MSRTSKGPSYEASKRRFVANLNREKIVLLAGVDDTTGNRKLAWDAYYRERAVAQVQVKADRSEVWAVLKAWLKWLSTRPHNPVAPNTLARHKRVVDSFTELHGKVVARDVRAWHLEDWLTKMQQPRPHPVTKRMVRWKEGSVKIALGSMRTAFRWATSRGLLSSNPFHGPDAGALENPTVVYTGRRKPVEREEYEALLKLAAARSHKDWAVLLMLLWGTGARPSELIEARAEEWDDSRRAFVIRCEDPANVGRFKLKRLKRDRVVYVPDELVPFVRLLAEKYAGKQVPDRAGRPVTFLFRKEKGKTAGTPMTLGSVNAHFVASREKVNKDAGREVIRDGIKSYNFRHAFVTRWVSTGRDIKMLAELLGTSVQMIERHYSHLFKRHDLLRGHLNQFTSAGEA